MSAAIAALEHATGGLWPYLVVILFGFLPSEIWRWLSVFLVKGLDEDSQILVWVRAVATALLAGVVAKMLLSPSGALAVVPALWRWGALLGGCLAFFLFRRSIMAGVIVGEALLIGAAFYATA
ncbi:MAG: AzlD domain-containing protein [Proteobacteria bacterium]|nr:AzlD domain-containing protein [Pseudomonadota bacterium]